MKKKNLFISVVLFVLVSVFIFFLISGIKKFNSKVCLLKKICFDIELNAKHSGLDYSLYIEELKIPSLRAFKNDDEKFPAASLIKIPILAASLEAVKEGKISLSDEVIINKKDITGGSGELKKKKLPLKLTFNELLEYMISVSDNTATNKVISLLGDDYLNLKFKNMGLTKTCLSRRMMDFRSRRKGRENYTAAKDIALILERIYYGKLIDSKSSLLALDMLKKQKVNDRLPKYLPKGVVVAHKTGLEKGVVHDAGIVFGAESDYIICVLVKNTPNYSRAKKFIAQTSLLAYNLLQ
ncbi:MAG: class A beta-lactamase-related serine hydrolase [Candidatus Omnitrophica bacterium]|nr:class A beta-lactamase-related serine hydrolase [Candidatus Omnitrophota bacterium]MDD5429937.1 class A beta-lactamase-related serine hydrolase [Candidatus Omnitrophota bacterium]